MFDKKPLFAPLIYVLIAFPCILVCIFMLPPFQGADEDNHFFRAEQIALGNFVGTGNHKDSAGGYVDTSSIEVSRLVNHIKFHPEEKISPKEILALNKIEFSDNLTYTDFKNTVVYAPFFYLLRWVSEKWTSRNNLGDNYVLGGVHYETSASTVHCRVQKERC